MEIKGLSFNDQMRTIRGVDSIYPKAGESPKVDNSNKLSFAEMFENRLEEVNRLGIESDRSIERLTLGEEANPHAAMIAVQKADISFKLMTAVKDKLVQAYQQLVRTPIG